MEDIIKEDSDFEYSHSHPQTHVGQSTSTSAPQPARTEQGGKITSRDNLASSNTGTPKSNAIQWRGKATTNKGNLVCLILSLCFNLLDHFKYCLLVPFINQFRTFNIVHSLYG